MEGGGAARAPDVLWHSMSALLTRRGAGALFVMACIVGRRGGQWAGHRAPTSNPTARGLALEVPSTCRAGWVGMTCVPADLSSCLPADLSTCPAAFLSSHAVGGLGHWVGGSGNRLCRRGHTVVLGAERGGAGAGGGCGGGRGGRLLASWVTACCGSRKLKVGDPGVPDPVWGRTLALHTTRTTRKAGMHSATGPALRCRTPSSLSPTTCLWLGWLSSSTSASWRWPTPFCRLGPRPI